MNYKIKIFNRNTDEKYLPEMRALADLELSPGYLTDFQVSKFGDDDYYCSFALDENDKVCCVSYGRFLGLEEAAKEICCTVEETKRLFPGITAFASHLGLAVSKEARGNGIASEMMRLNRTLVFPKADVVFNDVWFRNGPEKPIETLLEKLGGKLLKKIPNYWYNYPGLFCTICQGRCVCDCDMYYYTKEGFNL